MIMPNQIFFTPEGMLSVEQGVYIAETVTSKNMKLARGRFRSYEDQNGSVSSSSFFHCYLYNFKICTLTSSHF